MYWSRIIVEDGTFTKYPLMKNTPSLRDAEEPVLFASDKIHLANELFAVIVVDPKLISDSVIRLSPGWNCLVVPSDPEELYLRYNVSNPSSDSTLVSLLTTVAFTPEISP